MKPSEQLTDEQRKRVVQIAENEFSDSPFFGRGVNRCERAILQALDEIIPQIVKRHDYSE